MIKLIKKATLVIIVMMLSVFAYQKANAWPDYIDINAGLKQHGDRPTLCKGDGMSDKLISRVGAEAGWTPDKAITIYAGLYKEFCILNEKSQSDTPVEIGIKYRFYM